MNPTPPGPDAEPPTRLAELFAAQNLAVLSTHGDGQPYCSLVAFASTPGLGSLVFATTRGTRKFHNLSRDPRVSLLVDSRANRESDFQDAMAATAVGGVEEVRDANSSLRRTYLAKHPYLGDFLGAPACALIRARGHGGLNRRRTSRKTDAHRPRRSRGAPDRVRRS